MKLLSAIHETCNGEQFEEINELGLLRQHELATVREQIKGEKG